MFNMFKKKETPSLWTHNSHEDGYPSANNLTSDGKKYQSEMMNSNPMKNFMFDRFFGVDEANPKYEGMNFFVIGDDKRDAADRVFRYQIEQLKSSFVISTSSLVLIGMVRGELAKHGYNIRILNFSTNDELGDLSNQVEQSMVYNIFEQASCKEEVEAMVTSMIKMSPTYAPENNFGNNVLKSLLVASILFKQINNDATYESICKFIQSAEFKNKAESDKQKSKFDKAFEEALLFANVGSEENKQRAKDAYDAYKTFCTACGKSRTYVIRAALELLKIYQCGTNGTRAKNFKLKEFSNKKFALFVVFDDKDKNLAAHGRVATEVVINQIQKENISRRVRFMIEGVEKHLSTTNFESLIHSNGKYSLTAVLHDMNDLSNKDLENVYSLNNMSDVLIYMGSQNTNDAKHKYVMDILGEAQKKDPEYKKVCKLAKKDITNVRCVYSPENNLTFEMSANEQMVFIRDQKPFLLTYIY